MRNIKIDRIFSTDTYELELRISFDDEEVARMPMYPYDGDATKLYNELMHKLIVDINTTLTNLNYKPISNDELLYILKEAS